MHARQSANPHAGDAENAVQRDWRRDNRAVSGLFGIFFIPVEFVIEITHPVAPVGNRLFGHYIIGSPDILSLKIRTDP
jgi:hypothetical protein